MDTRGESWKEYNNNGNRLSQKKRAELYLINTQKAVTSNMLSDLLNLDRTNITRILKDLEKENRIYIAHRAKCPKTGRKVRWYRANPSLGQGSLFKA